MICNRNAIICLFFIGVSCFQALCQVVWSDPQFPSQEDEVIIYFDSSKGNGGLSGFTGDIYAHTGVITNNSSSPSDWKHVQGVWGTDDARTKMESQGDGIYSLEININEFYGIPNGEEVLKLAFVFRNVDGSMAGRAQDGSDIFLDLYNDDDQLFYNLISPLETERIIDLGDSLRVKLVVNQEVNIIIDDNEEIVFSATASETDFYITPEIAGVHEVTITMIGQDETLDFRIKYFVLSDQLNIKDPPEGIKNGVNYFTDSSFVFQLTAPHKNSVFFLCPANNFQVDFQFLMSKSTDDRRFWIELPKALFGESQNMYQYLVDGGIKIADPYSEIVLDPWNDSGIPNDVKAEIPDYPGQMTEGIVTVFDVEDKIYPWTTQEYERPKKQELIVYELLMRDFLADHHYTSLLDTLDYLKDLGVNAIELMPVFEFEGNNSWGYNPSFHMAVDKYYGTRDQLKAVIDKAHALGMVVILDVVFNHTFSQGPLAQLYWDAANFRPAADNPWLNVSPRHPFNVGYDFNHESSETKAWVKQILSYWIEDFRFDGFRFDLSKGLTQKNSGNDAGLMGQYDPSRIIILKDYADHIWSLDPSAYVIMEHFAENREEKELSDYGMMLWGNSNHDFNEAAMGYSSSINWANYQFRDWEDPHIMGYVESHDEERTMYKVQRWGSSNVDYDTKTLETGLMRSEAVQAVFYSIPGPKMMWQFGELGFDFSINYCVNGEVSDDCRLDPKPIKWDYLTEEPRARLRRVFKNIFHLKTGFETFNTTDFEVENVDGYVKVVRLFHEDLDVLTVANFNVTRQTVAPGFSKSGTWYDYLSGKEVDVTDDNFTLDLGPGEYHIFTSREIVPPAGYTPFPFVVTEPPVEQGSYLYPNIALGGDVIRFVDNQIVAITNVRLVNVMGQTIHVNYVQTGEGRAEIILPENLANGMYVVDVESLDYIRRYKLIVGVEE